MKAIVKEAAKYVGISTGIALGIFCFVGMIFDLYYGGNFSLSGYQFTKMVVGCVVVGWGFGVPAVVYRKGKYADADPCCDPYGKRLRDLYAGRMRGWLDFARGRSLAENRDDGCPAGSSISDLVIFSSALPPGSERDE